MNVKKTKQYGWEVSRKRELSRDLDPTFKIDHCDESNPAPRTPVLLSEVGQFVRTAVEQQHVDGELAHPVLLPEKAELK